MHKDPSLTVIKKKTTTAARVSCKCSKSGCLKMYCECFTAGRFCDDTCTCKNCRNFEGNEAEIIKIKKAIRQRNPNAFK